jgi:hypothetical protein
LNIVLKVEVVLLLAIFVAELFVHFAESSKCIIAAQT